VWLQEFYETTLRALEKARNDRLWFKTNLKLVGLWFKAREYGRMHKILKDLHRCGTGEWVNTQVSVDSFVTFVCLPAQATQAPAQVRHGGGPCISVSYVTIGARISLHKIPKHLHRCCEGGVRM
jgi:hypothetical protein